MSMAMNQAQVKQQASLSVMKSTMSTAEQNGDALVEMLEASVPHPNLGAKIDVKA